MITRQDCLDLDAHDPLAPFRERFDLPAGKIYLDGNSLGTLPRAVPGRVAAVATEQWGRDLISSWNRHDWIGLPQAVGSKIARLIGAAADEVICADSVSVNLFKLAAAAVRAQAGRTVILTEAGDFPTDVYILQGLAGLLPGIELRVTPSVTAGDIDSSVALILLSHVHYRTGRVRDMAGINAAAHRAGALTLWDLSHSAGVLDVNVARDGCDLAAGCGYKYLNGGPGAPAYLFVAKAMQARLANPVSGWMGHAAPFAFDEDYRPADGMTRWLSGTPGVLGMAALDAALDAFDGVDMGEVRAKAGKLGDLFISLVETRLGDAGFDLASPRDAGERGGQVALAHPQAWPISQAMIHAGVIGDFRRPDLVRFGFAPLYVRYADVWDAVDRLVDIMATQAWRRPEYHAVAAVT